MGCRLAARAPAQLRVGLITGVRSPCFFHVTWAWKTGLFCLLDIPESFSQFGLWERALSSNAGLVEARSGVGGVAGSTPSPCPGQGNGMSQECIWGNIFLVTI